MGVILLSPFITIIIIVIVIIHTLYQRRKLNAKSQAENVSYLLVDSLFKSFSHWQSFSRYFWFGLQCECLHSSSSLINLIVSTFSSILWLNWRATTLHLSMLLRKCNSFNFPFLISNTLSLSLACINKQHCFRLIMVVNINVGKLY